MPIPYVNIVYCSRGSMTPTAPLTDALDRKYGTGNGKIIKIGLATFNSPVTIHMFSSCRFPLPGSEKGTIGRSGTDI